MGMPGLIVVEGRGHPNVTLKHDKTLEFTEEDRLGLRGDCIIAVRSKLRYAVNSGSSKGYVKGYIVITSVNKISVYEFTGVLGDCKKYIIRRTVNKENSIAFNSTIAASMIKRDDVLELKSTFTKVMLVACYT